MMSLVFYAVLLIIFGISLRRPFGALVEAGRQHANVRREMKALSASESHAGSSLDHLSPSLVRMVQDTRLLRVALAEPVQAVRSWHAADGNRILAHVDVGDGSDLDRLDEVDVALVNARRAVWDWIATVEALPENDQQFLASLGLTTGIARGVLTQKDAFRRTSGRARQEVDRVEQLLLPLIASLERFETGLAAATRTTGYR
jgi:hypothetical protein